MKKPYAVAIATITALAAGTWAFFEYTRRTGLPCISIVQHHYGCTATARYDQVEDEDLGAVCSALAFTAAGNWHALDERPQRRDILLVVKKRTPSGEITHTSNPIVFIRSGDSRELQLGDKTHHPASESEAEQLVRDSYSESKLRELLASLGNKTP